ncbi:MAG: winged helix-turn-helix domain-containing protein [Rhodospirillales bacterium]|nr:winged helix-turn-helix domain-containing protein [Rhodospirillales bacterium]
MRYHVNEITLDTDRFELYEKGAPLHVEPQVIELLVLLIENRDRMVSKEEINEKVWGGRIVSESSLSSCIKMARKALGDDGQTQKAIRTIHKKGFRFVADIVADPKEPTGDTTSRLARQGAQGGQGDQGSRTKPSVMILPLTNLSSEGSHEYMADGITSDIISHLSKHRWLNVTARSTSFGYKGKAVDIPRLGAELSVDYVVEGSVQRENDHIRVTVNLIDSASGHNKWSDRYEREISDIFTLQDEITHMIAARIEPEIGIAERNKITRQRPPDLQAWDCYHLGISHFYKFTADDNLEAQRLLLKSQHLDPNFGEPAAWWAYAVILGMVYWDIPPSDDVLDEALAACNRALSIDRQNASFHALQARVLLAMKEYDSAISANQAAISLNPTLAAAHCGLGDSLAYEARYEESIGHFEKAIALSPNDPQLWAFYSYGALAHILNQNFHQALEWLGHASIMPNCQYWTTAHKIVANAYLDRSQEAETEKTKLLRQHPGFSLAFTREKLFYLKQHDQIEFYLKGLEMAGIPAR